MKKIICTMLLLLFTLCMVGCSSNEYGYNFHFFVEEGNGKLIIEKTLIFNPRVQKCKDVEDMCVLDCSDDANFVRLLGDKNGSRKLTFIAIPEEGYKVKEWKYNGQIVENNQSRFFTAMVSNEDNYNGIISVSFEIDREKTYPLNYVLGFNESEITKIEYSITSGPTTGIDYEANLEVIIEKLDVEYFKMPDGEYNFMDKLLTLFYLYRNEEAIQLGWSIEKRLCITTSNGKFYSKEPVELLTINEYNPNVKYANSLFDLEEEKVIWNGSINEEFTDDKVLLVLKHSDSFPKLELKHFGLEEGSVEYIGGHLPPNYFYEPGYEDMLNNYKQTVVIHIEPEGKEKIIELIKYLEQIDFIYAVDPNYTGTYWT